MTRSTTDSLTVNPPATVAKTAPGPKGCLLFGNLSDMRRDAVGLLMRSAAEYGDVVRLHLVVHLHFVNHPDHVKHVLQDRHTNYEKDMMYDRMKPLVGDGLLTSNGDFW